MYTFIQILVGCAAALFLAVGGFYLGQATAPSETVACLNWAAAIFDEPPAGVFALLCHGS